MKVYKEFIEYFENLCVQHVDINHNPTSGIKGFFRINLEEVLTGSRNKIQADGYYVVLANYLWVPEDENTDPLKKIQFMFFVLGTSKEGDYELDTEVLDKTEKITREFINRISFDSKTQVVDEDSVFYGSQDKIKVDSIIPLQFNPGLNSFGWQVVMTAYTSYNICVEHQKWDDIADADAADPNNY